MKEELKYFAGLIESDWQMFPCERFALIGLMQILKPDKTLEIGHKFGGCTKHLSQYSKEVYTVDIDPYVVESSKRFSNVKAMHMSSFDAMNSFLKDNVRFDLAIIDGDHSESGTASDVELAIKLADVIILHDTANAECRKGYENALSKSEEVYYNLDFVDGKIIAEGIWGGLGLILTSCADSYKLVKPSISNFKLMQNYDASRH